jgi:hypothetical protein
MGCGGRVSVGACQATIRDLIDAKIKRLLNDLSRRSKS